MPAPRRLAALGAGLTLVTGSLALAATPAAAVPGAASTVFVNEIHYDNDGTDAGEFVEVANPAGADLTGWTVVLYNGGNGQGYDTDALSGTGTIQTIAYASNGVQNGSPDGVALVDSAGTVVQFLSYEGPLTAVTGPASGQTSTDIGVSQTGSDPAGRSLQLIGSGATYGDFTWTGPADDSPGAVNDGQTFTGDPSELAATDPADASATVGEPITPIVLEARGGTAPYRWQVTGLPAGLSETEDGRIEGTPTAEGTSTVTGTVTDSATPTPASDSVEFTIDVTAPSGPVAIAEIQGTGSESPLAGETVTTRGVVTAAYPTGDFFAFVIQTPGTGTAQDATPGASDALWVYQTGSGLDATIGEYVEVRGAVSERFGRTQLTYDPATPLTVLTEAHQEVTPLATTWWPTEAEREAHESELVDLSDQPFTVSDNYSTNQYGEIGLATGDRPLITPTEVANPTLDPAGYEAVVADNLARGVILDDGADWDYVADSFAKDDPLPWIDRSVTARVGADATLVGPMIVDYGFGAWRLQPTSQVNGPAPELVEFEDTRDENARPADVGGDLQIATFNVLNYFTALGDADNDDVGEGGCSSYDDRAGDGTTVRGGCDQRGAWDPEDFERQQAKIVAAINGLDAAVVSLEEIENSVALGKDRDQALSALVDALNAQAGEGRWEFVPSPPASELPSLEEQDVIRTAFIYDPSVVETVGGSKVLLDSPAFSNARQPLAQAFKPVGAPADSAFSVVVNHFKSKGSACAGEPEGPQGNCNESRVRQANALATFADEFAAERGTARVFLTGDFNSYSEEDPMIALERRGYTALDSDTEDEWSYSFDGQSGSLDHVLANDAALADVTGVDIWEINANEALAFEYSRHNYNVTQFWAPDVFRASDHNPELVGVDVRDVTDVDLSLAPSTIRKKKETTTATVAITGGDAPATGTVTFFVDGEEIDQRVLRDGTASIRLGPFERGSYQVTVEYAGDADHYGGTDSETLTVR